MDIKMIVTDLDDTLLRRDKTVSEYTAEVLLRCRELGIKTVIATGRGHPDVVAPLELFDGIIANNGANIFEGGAELRRCIPCAEARPLLLACHEHGLRLTSQFGGIHYTNFDTAHIWPHIKDFEIVDFASHSMDSEKICAEGVSPEDADFIAQHLTDNMYLKVARDGLGMVMHKDATKSAAIAELAERWHIARREIAAFGDDLNDIDLLSYAGISVAMKNAIDEVKAAADYICDDCDNDGVAKWLAENVL
ncbi:MAG: HAD family hydrolase [Oscillospiraceae bacterium]|jgi:Cof subfamily protein (haloacid dehalogenase superfamily)|nr:HAD family hydrolase [Oscillospiraceae bacterium]